MLQSPPPLADRSPRRSAALARAMLDEYGLTDVRLELLRRRRHVVYQVDAARGRRFVLRIHHESEMPRQAGEAQLDWLTAIKRDTTLAVPTPVMSSRDGAIATRADDPAVWCVLFNWVEGRHLNHPRRFVTADVLTSVGRAAAELHVQSARYRRPKLKAIRRWDAARLLDGEACAAGPRGREVFTAREQLTILRAADRIRFAMDDLGRDRQHFGLIHGDLEPPNWVFHKGQPRLIDFDEFGLGYYLYDLLHVIWTHAMWPQYPDFRRWLLEGYESICPLSSRERRHLDVFQAIPFISWLDRGVAPRDEGDCVDFARWRQPTLRRIRKLCQVK